MSSSFGRLTLIANPEAGRRKVRAAVEAVEQILGRDGLEYEVQMTEAAGDATRLARRARESGGRFVVAVGGDGTVHEVVNGVMLGDGALEDGALEKGVPGGRALEKGAIAADPVLGVVAAGSGSDFVRTFGLPMKPAAAAERLVGDDVTPLDLAKIAYTDHLGRPAVRYFANIAEAGLGATTAARAGGLPRLFGPSRYFFAFWAVLPSYRPGSMRIEVDGAVAHEGRAVNVVAANCRYFGGGMHISPFSDPADGEMELLVFTGRKTDSFTMLPQVYRGRHMPHRNIVQLKGRRFRLEPDQPFAIEADGEVLGTTPATVEVVPRAITLKV